MSAFLIIARLHLYVDVAIMSVRKYPCIEVIRTFVTLDRKVILVEFAGISSFELLHFAFDFQLLTFNLFNQSAVSTRQIFFII